MREVRAAGLVCLGILAVCPRAAVAGGDRADVHPPAPVHVAAHPADDDDRDVDEDIDAEVDDSEVIVIEGRAPQAPGNATDRDVDAETLAVTPRRSADDLLRLVPGLYIAQHASEGKAQQFFLRGFDAVHGSDVEVIVAGVSVNEPSNVHGHGYVDLGFVVPEVVRSLHAHKGSFVLDQGNFATAGSVEMALGVPADRRGHRVTYEIGSTNRHRVLAVAAPLGLPEASFVAAEAMTDDGFGENRATRKLTGLTQHRVVIPSDGAGTRFVEILAAAYAAEFGEPGTIPVADLERDAVGFYDAYDDDSRGESYRALATARFHAEAARRRFDVRLHGGWRRLSLSENFTGFLVDEVRGDRLGQDHGTARAGLEARGERDLTRWLTVIGGGGGELVRLRQTVDRLDRHGYPWAMERSVRATEIHGHAFAGARLAAGRFRAAGGARVDAIRLDATDRLADRDGEATLVQVSPRLQAAVDAGGGVRLFAGYGRGLRSPEARSVVTPSDPVTGITTSDAVEAGARLRRGGVTASAGVFGVWIANEMVFDHLSGVNLARNRTRRLGVELAVEARPLSWLTLRGDVSATDARFTGSCDPVPGAPRLLARFETHLVHPSGWRGGARLGALGPRPLAHGATGEGHAVLDLIAGVRLGRFDLELSIDNATNARVREGEFHYASWFDKNEPRSQIPRLHYTAGRPLGARASVTARF